MKTLAGAAVSLVTLVGVFVLLWRFCKNSERLRVDDPPDMEQRQRDAEGADKPWPAYDPDDGYETDDYYGGPWRKAS